MTFLGIRARFVPPTTKQQVTKGKAVSVYVDDGTGTYRPNEDGTFPTTGYVLNTEKSGCANGGVLSQNPETKTISLSVSGSDQCHVYFDKEKQGNEFANMLIAKANNASITDYNSGNKGEMFAFDHTATGQVSDWTADELRDYRYIGSSPNNYIQFNDETWRIIGVFTVEVEKEDKTTEKKQLVKIIRDESIGQYSWDSTKVNGYSKYTNGWVNGTLYKLLNGSYYNGLSLTAQSQIANVKFYLGGSSTASGLNGPDYYAFERGTATCATEGKCSGQTRETSIIQNVGLMYPSDYVYTYANGVDDTCYTDGNKCDQGIHDNGWLFGITEWTQSPFSGASNQSFLLYIRGYIFSNEYFVVNVTNINVRPVVYLKSDIPFSGTGSSSNPYALSLS